MDTANIAAVTGGVLSFDWKQCYAVTASPRQPQVHLCFTWKFASHMFLCL